MLDAALPNPEAEINRLVTIEGYTLREAKRSVLRRAARGPHSFLPQSDDDITEL